ncbi:hypothetical protein [Paracoccus aminophilus]|uniref:Uncharacterized protein n=1 Tax=Paracoccus aminophilus JCM 7686 TaxID=1367847 RepID=S5Y7X6_PARAH|nr:hypothetical protein [Paracoccus aminophilus]AGT07448.1 hypothetical protein JCM7686_0339 [Paracoccus aminophilus JCM 7686]
MTIFQMLEALLLVGSAVLGFFCFSLSRKLRRLNDLENGIGGAIAVLISECTRLEQAMAHARSEATRASAALAADIERSKQERAYWVLQQSFTPPAEAGHGPRLRRRRASATEGLDA